MTIDLLAPKLREQLKVIRTSGSFDRDWYTLRYPDVSALGLDPDFHYVWVGARLGRDPSPNFCTRFYLEQNPDVAQSGLNPFFHYLTSGREEGRSPLPPAGSPAFPMTTHRTVHYRVDRSAAIRPGDDWVLFAAYTPDGRLSDCQRHQITLFKQAGYRVALILNSDDFSNLADPGASDSDIQIVRENVGFDFGAWRHAIELLGGLNRAERLTFTNDSILPIGGSDDLARLRSQVASTPEDVVFMTDNLEIRPHSQSYFFSISREAVAKGALSVIAATPYYTDKDSLIHEVEIYLSDQVREAGYSVRTLFSIDGIERNPTIHHWEELLELGLPFLKVQLLTARILTIEDQRLKVLLDERVTQWLREHCHRRHGSPKRVNQPNVAHVPAFRGTIRFNDYGAQQAFNLPAEQNPTVRVPLDGIAGGSILVPRILSIIHGYYVDVAIELLAELTALELPMRILITTDQQEKVEALEAEIVRLGLTGQAVLCPNRGRDVAPLLIEGRKFVSDAEVILHLHTKKSPHDDVYAGWGSYLRRNLIGSRDIVLSILKILQETEVGLVYSDHFSEVVNLRNWGFDYDHARELLARLGITIDADAPLEFPTSTMFWARRQVLDPLLNAGLNYEDFEEEAGQVDGTLAHAIERSLLYVAEAAGTSFVKVTADSVPSEPRAELLRLAAGDLSYALNRPRQFLTGGATLLSDFYRTVPEVYPVSVGKSRSERRRVTALLPTMKPEKIYGGITTALKTIEQIVDALPQDVDLRVLITSDSVDTALVAELSRRLKRSFAWAMPDDDPKGDTIVGVAENQHVPISLRVAELYIATAWWTADLGYRLLDRQQQLHGSFSRLAYIIQDFEPGFYNWSNTFALADATYRRGDNTLAIINSEELTGYMLARYKFAQAFCLPYEPHPTIAELIQPTVPDRLILAYGRPSTSRNCFDLLCEGIRVWQARSPVRNGSFEIVFAGEDFDAGRLTGLLNARNVGKMSIDDYAAVLNRAAIGISLMVSPHPSYPPLEMALAGCVTITNAYEGKDLSLRAENILSLDSLTPNRLADCLDEAVSRVKFDEKKTRGLVAPLPAPAPWVDYDQVADWMLGEGATLQSGFTDRDQQWDRRAITQNRLFG